MLGPVIGRIVNGALWGLGAAAVLAVANSESRAARPTAKRLMKVCVTAADRLQEITATTRETLEDLYAEVRADQQAVGQGAGPFADGGLISIMRGERDGNEGPDNGAGTRR